MKPANNNKLYIFVEVRDTDTGDLISTDRFESPEEAHDECLRLCYHKKSGETVSLMTSNLETIDNKRGVYNAFRGNK